jgi:hypothetical protein
LVVCPLLDHLDCMSVRNGSLGVEQEVFGATGVQTCVGLASVGHEGFMLSERLGEGGLFILREEEASIVEVNVRVPA